MVSPAPESLTVRAEADVVSVRQAVRAWTVELGFSLINQTKMITAASELARNLLVYGGGGTVACQPRHEGLRVGLRLVFSDQGPGIADLNLALQDGYTTGGGLGLGLSGSKRLANEFDIESTVGVGTRVTITRWK